MTRATVSTLALLLIIGGLLVEPALAAGGVGGGGLPWETPMQTLSGSLGGTVAFSIGVIAFVIAGAILVFGNDLSDFARRVVLVVLACSMIFLSATFLTTLFGAAGAVL